MSLKTHEGIIGIGKQTAKGTANTTPDYFIKYTEGTFDTEMDTTNLREAGSGELIGTSLKNTHKQKFSFKLLARPQAAAYLFGWLMGSDTVTGSADPYTHTVIRDVDSKERPWLTIRRKLTTNVTQQITDCKLESVEIAGEAGQAITLTVEGRGLSSEVLSVEDTPSYEATAPFMFYDSCDNFTIDGASNKDIKSYTVKVTVGSEDGQQTDCLLLGDIQDLKFDVDFSCDTYVSDTSFWKKINYNNQTTPQEDLYSLAFEADHVYTENAADDREFKINIAKIIPAPVTLPIASEPSAMTQTFAGPMVKPDSGEAITITVKNSVSTAIN